MSSAQSRYSESYFLQLKMNRVAKKIETLQILGLIVSGFIGLNGLFLISETVGVTLLLISLFGGFFIYLFTQGWIAVIVLLMQIEINTRS